MSTFDGGGCMAVLWKAARTLAPLVAALALALAYGYVVYVALASDGASGGFPLYRGWL